MLNLLKKHSCMCDLKLLRAFVLNFELKTIILPCTKCDRVMSFNRDDTLTLTDKEMHNKLNRIKKCANNIEDVKRILKE